MRGGAMSRDIAANDRAAHPNPRPASRGYQIHTSMFEVFLVRCA